jgi:hypothetical protein
MKAKVLVAVAVVSGALVSAALAAAKTTEYSGPIKPSGALSFKLTQKPDFTRLRNGFSFSKLPVRCSGHNETTSGHLTFPIKVEHRHFTATAKTRHGGASLVLKGKFTPGYQGAKGTIRIRGKRVPIDSGGRHRCGSGVRKFRVKPV